MPTKKRQAARMLPRGNRRFWRCTKNLNLAPDLFCGAYSPIGFGQAKYSGHHQCISRASHQGKQQGGDLIVVMGNLAIWALAQIITAIAAKQADRRLSLKTLNEHKE